MCFVLAKLLQKYDRSCHKNLIPVDVFFLKKVFGLAVWQPYFIWRWAVLFKFVGELISVSKIVQRRASFPPKSTIRYKVLWHSVIEAPYTEAWDGFVMHLIIYILLGRLSAEEARGICCVNQLSPRLFLFSGGRKHTVSPVFLPAGSHMLTKAPLW